jgi:hypothetical protein
MSSDLIIRCFQTGWPDRSLVGEGGGGELISSITLSMIPPSMLHSKPIDLRHICLFYLGHM